MVKSVYAACRERAAFGHEGSNPSGWTQDRQPSVVKLVYAASSEGADFGHAGSTPAARTQDKQLDVVKLVYAAFSKSADFGHEGSNPSIETERHKCAPALTAKRFGLKPEESRFESEGAHGHTTGCGSVWFRALRSERRDRGFKSRQPDGKTYNIASRCRMVRHSVWGGTMVPNVLQSPYGD